MKNLLLSLMRAFGRAVHDESGEFLPARRKSQRLREYLPGRPGE